MWANRRPVSAPTTTILMMTDDFRQGLPSMLTIPPFSSVTICLMAMIDQRFHVYVHKGAEVTPASSLREGEEAITVSSSQRDQNMARCSTSFIVKRANGLYEQHGRMVMAANASL